MFWSTILELILTFAKVKLSKKIFCILLFLSAYIFLSCSDEPTAPEYPSYDWPTSTPELQGMNSQLIEQAFQQAGNRGFVDCILIIRTVS